MSEQTFVFLPPVAFYGMSQEDRVKKLFEAYKVMSEKFAKQSVLDGEYENEEQALSLIGEDK